MFHMYMCVCIYIYIHVCIICVHSHACIHTYKYTYIYIKKSFSALAWPLNLHGKGQYVTCGDNESRNPDQIYTPRTSSRYQIQHTIGTVSPANALLSLNSFCRARRCQGLRLTLTLQLSENRSALKGPKVAFRAILRRVSERGSCQIADNRSHVAGLVPAEVEVAASCTGYV